MRLPADVGIANAACEVPDAATGGASEIEGLERSGGGLRRGRVIILLLFILVIDDHLIPGRVQSYSVYDLRQ